MAVDSVNGNNNTALYTGIGTVAGAGGGVATGYLTRPFLKNGAPTDKFVKEINSAILKSATTGRKSWIEERILGKSILKEIDAANDIETIKNLMVNFDACGDEELSRLYTESFDTQYANRPIDQVKISIKNEFVQKSRDLANEEFNHHWDLDKKKFINCEGDELGKTIKGIARKIQGKYAAIYGSLGAAALGIGTYLCCRDKQPKTQTQTPDNKVQS